MRYISGILLFVIICSFTASGLKSFIKPDTVDECTWIEINEFADLDSRDVIVLTKLINSEAHGESMIDKLLVGSTVLNRVDHPEFPNNIFDVVYQNRQFHGTTSRLFRYYKTNKYDGDSRKAAMLLLKYGPFDPDVLYFLDPMKTSDTRWLDILKDRGIIFRGRVHWYFS